MYCGAEGFLTRDHLVPKSKGGLGTIDNIAPACSECNEKKGDGPVWWNLIG